MRGLRILRMARLDRVLSGLLAVFALQSVGVEAERAVTLAPRIEPVLSEAARVSLLQALDRALAAEHVEVVHSNASAPCADSQCEQAARTEAQAAEAVQLTLWRDASDSSANAGASGVSVTIALTDESRYSEGAPVAGSGDAAIASAVVTATHGAFERMRRGPGPWLKVTGRPAGGSVFVDGQPLGPVPGRYRVAGGLHHVVVSANGFTSYDETVTVPRNLDGWKQVEIELQPLPPIARAPVAATRRRMEHAHPVNFAIAGAAVALGVVLGIGPVRTIAEDGECGRVEDGRCTGVVELDAGSTVQLSAAALLVAGGAVFAVWAPIRARVYSDGVDAEFRVRF